jgi:hypothetical protein
VYVGSIACEGRKLDQLHVEALGQCGTHPAGSAPGCMVVYDADIILTDLEAGKLQQTAREEIDAQSA